MSSIYSLFVSFYCSSVLAEEDYYLVDDVGSNISVSEKDHQCIQVIIFSIILFINLYSYGFIKNYYYSI